MKKKLTVAFVIILIFVVMTAYGCIFQGCDLPANISKFMGFSNPETSTHQYGGFLGIGTKTCTVQKQYSIFHEVCSKGHLNRVVKTLYREVHSSCGR